MEDIIIYTLIGLTWLSTIVNIGSIGNTRPDYTKNYAIASVFVSISFTLIYLYLLK